MQLGDATSLDAVRAAIDAYADEHPDRSWIVAEGWNYAALPDRRRPRAEDLDGVAPGRAVMVFSYDVHNLWLNAEAMRRFGVDAADALAVRSDRARLRDRPAHRVPDRLRRDGSLARSGRPPWPRRSPNFSTGAVYRRLLRSLDMAAELGITTAVEPQNSVDDLPLFVRAREEGRLRSRVIAALVPSAGDDGRGVGRVRRGEGRPRRRPVPRRSDQALHRRRDRAAHRRDARAVREPAGHRAATTFYPPEVFAELIVELERRGFQTFTHATGDRGIRTVLDAVAHARRVHGPRDARHQIVHVECVHPDDLTRFAELGVVACMQPRHCAPEIVADWRANVGPERWPFAWPFRSLRAAGATLAFSSDWNVAEMDPLVWLYSACTRADLDGGEAWVPEETLDLPAAIRAATLGSAFANFAEGDGGSLTPGKYADVVVLSRDVFADGPAALLDTAVDVTIVGGEVVHRRG